MEITRTFFDEISSSSVEKIHSSVIVWLFCLDKKILSDVEKSRLIKALFNIRSKYIFKSFKAYAELNTIDILIECDTAFFAIENKLKSSEHSEQTNRIETKVPKKISNEKKPYFGFLSLVGERPIMKDMTIVTYSKLYKELKTIKSNDQTVNTIYNEYLKTLKNLTTAFRRFSKHPDKYENVFAEGHMKKHEKKEKSDSYQQYIQINQLETIFQKAFLLNIGAKLNLNKNESFKIEESHGIGLLQIYLEEFLFNGKTYQIGIQLQGKSLKINLADKEYNKSSGKQINDEIKEKFKTAFSGKNEYGENLNLPKKRKRPDGTFTDGKAYISVSKKFERELYEYTTKEITEFLNYEIDYLRKIIHSKTFML